MTCPQCADFLKPGAQSCAECGWSQRKGKPAKDEPKNAGIRWAPETPHVAMLKDWLRAPQWEMPQGEVAEALAALKAKLVTAERQPIDPAKEARYLANCAKRPRDTEAPR